MSEGAIFIVYICSFLVSPSSNLQLLMFKLSSFAFIFKYVLILHY